MKLTDEQREAIEWAAGRAHVAALGKPIDGVEGRRWRVLSDLFRAAPVAADAAAPTQTEFVIRALIAAGHVTQAKVDEAIEIARKTPGVAPLAAAGLTDEQREALGWAIDLLKFQPQPIDFLKTLAATRLKAFRELLVAHSSTGEGEPKK